MRTSAQRVRVLGLSPALLLAAATLAGASLAIAPVVAHAGDESGRGKVSVRIAFANNGQDVADGSVSGIGHFTATGAITDKGKSVIYRTRKGLLITLRFVTMGKKGTITFVVKIDPTVGTSRWTIASGTRAYKGLHGKGNETENAPQYTVSRLTGTVWR
jgi:hypothetical protein